MQISLSLTLSTNNLFGFQVVRIVDEEYIFDILASKVHGIYRVELKSRNVDYVSCL